MKRAQDEVLAHISAGLTVRDAVGRAGRSEKAYEKWRQEDPEFRARLQAVRAGVKSKGEVWGGGFGEFRKVFFGMDTYVHQAQLVDALESVKAREVVMVLLWPEAGKTTTVEDWVCKTLALDPNRRIAILSEGSDHAKKIVSHIKTRMTDTGNFTEYITRFGPFREDGQARDGKPWASDHFTVLGSTHDERDYSLAARAIKSSAYGSRIDDLIIDDVQSEKNLNQTDQILRTIRQTYFTRGRHMRVVIIGTRIGPGDVYERFLESGIVTRLIELPALKADGTLTCPEIWVENPGEYATSEALHEAALKVVDTTREQITPALFEASYQQNPQSEGLATFTEAALNACKNPTRKIGAAAPAAYVALSLDPALDGGNALTACEHTPKKLYILDQQVDYGLATNEAIIEGIRTFALNYRPSMLIVEIDALQKGLAADLRLEEIAAELGFVIMPHMTSGKKLNNPHAVAAMATSFAREEIDIPWGDQPSRERLAPLLDQLRAWRPNIPTKRLRQDATMSLWFQWRHWALTREHMAASDLFETMRLRALPYEPTELVFS